MGTKVHCKSYAPEVCYSIRDLNDSADSGSWHQCFEDKTFNAGHYYGHFFPKQTSCGYSENEKEELKQKMLKHEVIFRNQVHELHRLYRIQRELMDKLKRKELDKYRVPMEALQSCSSQAPSEDANKLWRIPQSPMESSSCTRPCTSNFHNMQSSMNFTKEGSMKLSPFPADKLVESTFNKCPPKKLELQLPVDEYLASKEGGEIEESEGSHVVAETRNPLKRYCTLASENKTCDEDPSAREDASNAEPGTWFKYGLADLNEPLQSEEAVAPTTINFLGTASCNSEIQGKDSPSKPNSVYVGLSMEFLLNSLSDRDDRTCVSIPSLFNKGARPELEMPTSYSNSHQSNSVVGSSSVSSWMKPKRTPCFKSSASLCDTDSKFVSSFGSKVSRKNVVFDELEIESSSSQSRYHPVTSDYNPFSSNVASEDIVNGNSAKYLRGSNCMDVKSARDTNLNLTHLSNLQVGVALQQDFVLDGERKNEDQRRESTWLMKLACNDGTSEGREVEMEKAPLMSSAQNFAAPSSALVSESQMVEVIDCPRKKRIHRFPVSIKPLVPKDHSSLISFSKSLQFSLEEEETQSSAPAENLQFDLSNDHTSSNSGQQCLLDNLVVENKLGRNCSYCKNYIHLNVCTKCHEASSKPCIPGEATRIVTENLEVSVNPGTVGGVCSEKEYLRNRLQKPRQSSKFKEDTPLELVKIAAETIVIISASGGHDCSADITGPSLEAPLKDPLYWFAEVTASITSDAEGVAGDDGKSSSSVDYFESMTLKLTESKLDELCCKHRMPEYLEGVTGTSSLITHHWKGKTRRGRQPRNFQRDVLPGLSSLAKHEVSEDLQMLEGLMRSTGHSWQTGLARRNAARNGQTRGRGRPQSSNLVASAHSMCTPMGAT
ncbi:putative T-box transcription factor [Thalictrum thalictroides]|uniref:Putative T-box transcription factor n=1 Tax=Thalictrum thalictroides TaxID=46969 RepID=A0A7J6WTV5_THATH|nr:putative T-box transcription factor [Thalictrum thalictroides]